MFSFCRISFRTAGAVKCCSLVGLASGWVNVVTLAQRESLVAGGTGASNVDFGTRELVGNALVNTRLEGCRDSVSMLSQIKLRRLTTVAGSLALLSTVRVEVSLSLLGELQGILVVVFGAHIGVFCG